MGFTIFMVVLLLIIATVIIKMVALIPQGEAQLSNAWVRTPAPFLAV